MAEEMRIKRGNGADLPLLGEGELALALDRKTLYAGTGTENIPVNAAGEGPLDFDLLANSKGYKCVTTKTSTGYTETITKSSTAKRAAYRTTTKLSNGYRETVNFYEGNGTTVKETRTKTITKTATGFSEVIT